MTQTTGDEAVVHHTLTESQGSVLPAAHAVRGPDIA